MEERGWWKGPSAMKGSICLTMPDVAELRSCERAHTYTYTRNRLGRALSQNKELIDHFEMPGFFLKPW